MRERERIIRTLRGERTRLLPWATRLDIWHTSHKRNGTLPAEFAGTSLMEIHRHLGVGRQSYVPILTTRLRGVDLSVTHNGVVVQRESNPCLRFPKPFAQVPVDQPGETVFTLKTPVGLAEIRYRTTEEILKAASQPYLIKRILSADEEFEVVQWILDHSEVVPDYETFEAREAEIGDDGFTIGMMDRVPFQRLLLDFMGEERTVYQMLDNPARFAYLLDILTAQGREMVQTGLDSPALLVEFPDNFDGMITSPRLFQKYCIPFLQETAERVHAQGRFLGSHMDGDLKPLLHLIPESGVDVVESFSPSPLSRLSFPEAWEAWRGKVLMWGAVPSPLFEQNVPGWELEHCVCDLLDWVGGDGLIILGIADQAVGQTLIERVRRVSRILGRLSEEPVP